MQTGRDTWIKQSHENLFKDHYGILKLAAHATLTKTPVYSKIPGYLSLKWVQWVLAIIKRLWQRNTITFSEFAWLEPEILTYKIIDESHAKTIKKSGMHLNRGGKKINYKRRSNVWQKNRRKKDGKQPSIID